MPPSRKALVLLAGLGSVARVRRKHLAGDLFGHFEGEAEGRGHAGEQAPPEFRAGELVESEIAAHRGKCFGVFPQALGFEQPPREAAARQIPFARIDLAQPALILPRASADIDILCGQLTQLLGQPIAVKTSGFVEQRVYHACEKRK